MQEGAVAANAMVTGLAKAATTQTSLGEMSVIDVKSRKLAVEAAAALVVAEAEAAAVAEMVADSAHKVEAGVVQTNSDVMAQCEAVVIEEMTATDHTKLNHI